MLFGNLCKFLAQLFNRGLFTLPLFGEDIEKQWLRDDLFHLIDLLNVLLVDFFSLVFGLLGFINCLEINGLPALHRHYLLVVISSPVSGSRSFVGNFFVIFINLLSFLKLEAFLSLNRHFNVIKLCF